MKTSFYRRLPLCCALAVSTWLAGCSAGPLRVEPIKQSLVVTWGPKCGSNLAFSKIRLSSDGRWLATASRADLILWDVSARRLYRRLPGHTETVNSLSFSGDNRFLTSAGYDGTARVWEVATGHEVRVFSFPSYDETGQVVQKAELNADGSLLLVEYGSIPKRVTVWQVGTGNQLVCTWPQFSPDAASFKSSSENRGIGGRTSAQICDALSKPLPAARVPAIPEAFAFTPDFRRLAVGDAHTGEVHLWNLDTGVEEATICCGAKDEYGVDKYQTLQLLAYSPDGQRLASSDWSGNVMLWDLRSQQVVRVAVERYLATTAFSSDGGQLLFASYGGPLDGIDVTSRQKVPTWGSQIISVNLWVALAIVFLYVTLCHYLIAMKLHMPRPWRAWIPVWNLFLLVEMADKPAWWVVLLLIPVVSTVVGFILWWRICIALGESPWLVVTLLIPILGLFTLSYLAFGPHRRHLTTRAVET